MGHNGGEYIQTAVTEALIAVFNKIHRVCPSVQGCGILVPSHSTSDAYGLRCSEHLPVVMGSSESCVPQLSSFRARVHIGRTRRLGAPALGSTLLQAQWHSDGRNFLRRVGGGSGRKISKEGYEPNEHKLFWTLGARPCAFRPSCQAPVYPG